MRKSSERRTSRRAMKQIANEESGALHGDKAVAAAGFPHQFVNFMMHVATTSGINIGIRVGNPPKLGGNFQSKSMAVKEKTGAAFLFKCLIPTDNDFLKSNSKEIQQKSLDTFGESQLQVSLNEILADKDSYRKIEEKNGKLYLYPANDQIDDKKFKNPDAVRETVFVIDLKTQTKPTMSPEELQKAVPGTKITNYDPPQWWDSAWGDFSEVQHNLMPVSYEKNGQQEQPFMVLGDPAITGDIDLFWLTAFQGAVKQETNNALSLPNAHEKYNLLSMDPVETDQFLVAFNSIVNQMNSQYYGAEAETMKFNFEDFQSLKIEGIATPCEVATIYMVNQFFGAAAGEKMAQMILHGPESNNPGTPSEIEELLHVLPDGNIILTRDEDELIELVMSENFLENYPVPIHPKWNMEKWAPVVEQKLHIEKAAQLQGKPIPQKLSVQTIQAYEDFKIQQLQDMNKQPVNLKTQENDGLVKSAVSRFTRSFSNSFIRRNKPSGTHKNRTQSSADIRRPSLKKRDSSPELPTQITRSGSMGDILTRMEGSGSSSPRRLSATIRGKRAELKRERSQSIDANHDTEYTHDSPDSIKQSPDNASEKTQSTLASSSDDVSQDDTDLQKTGPKL